MHKIDITHFKDNISLISFTDIKQIPKNDKIDTLYIKNNRPIVYEKRTMEFYRICRKLHIDPITGAELDINNCFKFEYEWDPFTGEKLAKDPYGPLCFDPDHLIKYFYENRLNHLWVDPSDEGEDGYYQGYYSEAIGCGEKFIIPGRGHFPQWELFRLPIIDCYLEPEHNNQVITFGPKITPEEIVQIENLANKNKNNYRKIFNRTRPSLTFIKKFYDMAISKTPDIEGMDISELGPEELRDIYNGRNRHAVDKLKAMKG